ncbi:MAG TPA: iron ABC transporter permease [candidate division Zixibacteria bacterium]|nr:iron ABC transporter permease [candidate division Zixibacteria bacterium]
MIARGKIAAGLAVMVGALAVTAALPLFGTVDISLSELFGGALSDSQRTIFFDVRLPRVALGFLAGGALAVAGLVFQSLLRNPLATPFTLGVASGASLGSALYIHAGVSWAVLGLSGGTWFAFGGALGASGLVFAVARAVGRRDNVTLLLSGVAVTFFFSSLILFAQYIADFTAVFKMIRWVMGGLSVVGFDQVWSLAPFALAAAALAIWKSPELNLIATGDDLAHSRGVNVSRVRTGFFIFLSLATGAAVALVGPIGFVGMMVPHMLRLVFGSDNRVLAPVTFVVGGAFLALCDALARTILSPAELPVGIITALLGGPFFLWLLVKTRGAVRL